MRHAPRFISVASSMFLLAGLTACVAPPTYPQQPAASYPATTYPAQNQQGSYVEYGRVSNIEVFQTQGQAQGTGVGAVLGGVTGAVIGHQIGHGGGRDAATVIGAVGGAVAGNAIEKSRNTTVQESYRVTVQLDNRAYRAYNLPSTGDLRPGDRVRIENGQLFRY